MYQYLDIQDNGEPFLLKALQTSNEKIIINGTGVGPIDGSIEEEKGEIKDDPVC